MASVKYRPQRGARSSYWSVRWREGGRQREKSLPTREAADEFAATLPPPRGRGGGTAGKPRTDAQMRDYVAANTAPDASGCLVWTGPLTPQGYANATWQRPGMKMEAGGHRIAYILAKGEIPAGLVIDHLCRNRACVNSDHLDTVVQRENVMRSPIAPGAINAAKTHCPQGHPYDVENTYVWRHTTRSTTVRICKTCNRERARKYYQRKRAESTSKAVPQ